MRNNKLWTMIQRSLATKVTLSIITVFLLTVSVSSYVSFQEEKSRALEMITVQMKDRSMATFDSLNMLMLTGSMDEREILRKKLMDSPGMLDIRFLRGEAVVTQYGEGLSDESATHAKDRLALAGQEVVQTERIDGKRALTVISPLKATHATRNVDCLACHNAESGQTIGAVRFTVSLESQYQAIEHGFLKTIMMNLLLFLIGLYMIRVLMLRILMRPLQQATEAAKRVASGDMGHPIHITSHDEIGALLSSLNTMQSELFSKMNADKEAALRIKEALDATSTPVQIADVDYGIFYCNEAGYKMFRKYAKNFQTKISGFNPDQVVGFKIDQFHENPSHQHRLLDALVQPYQSEDVDFGCGVVMSVIASPVFDLDKKRIATILEWTDRTEEVAIEAEVGQMVSASLAGDLTQRINQDSFSDSLKV